MSSRALARRQFPTASSPTQIDALHNRSGRVRFLNATTHQPDITDHGLRHAKASVAAPRSRRVNKP